MKYAGNFRRTDGSLEKAMNDAQDVTLTTMGVGAEESARGLFTLNTSCAVSMTTSAAQLTLRTHRITHPV